jgi:superfamily II DNA or RNA helicase
MEHKEIKNIKSYKLVYPQIYSYTLPNRHENQGSQKIGYTEQENVEKRILPQVKTAGLHEEHKTLWSGPAFFQGGEESFRDEVFHKFLVKSGVENKKDLGKEWFFFNGHPEKSKNLFNLFREKGFSALQADTAEKTDYVLRSEQEDAVVKAKEYFENNEKGEFLWNAKPRFGKTLASYDLAKRIDAKKVLIVTNRPAIANSWFDDYEEFIDGYVFISETSSLKERATITRKQHIAGSNIKPHFTFLSLQDLKQSIYFGGGLEKLSWIADHKWDLLIIDEAHEGIDTERTNAAFSAVNRKHTLHLSGTPFKQLANEKFSKEAIFNWTYLDEQKIKQIEIEEDETGQHTELPDLKLFTYRISQMTTDQVNEGVEIDNKNHDFTFDLNQFFATNSSNKFIHEEEVKAFLKNLSTNEKYPFSTPELRNELKHTFWYVGNRVNSVKALEPLLKQDPVFKDYKVIVAAGDGRTREEEENNFKANEDSFKKVKKAISENEKTITLSCGQLTTGVTVKEWTAVLMLADIKSPSEYMQTAFRAQNPFKEYRNGDLYVKKSAYLFDFAPTRVLEIYDNFANGLDPKAVQGQNTELERKDNIKELLNFFPVISEDVNGQMVELDAEKVLAFPNALAASEIVNARFMTNLLFNDNVKGVFSFPKEVEEIISKMSVEKNKRVEKAKTTLDLDDARTVEQSKQKNINENTEIILGEKIFRSNADRVVDNLLGDNGEITSSQELISNISDLAEPLISAYKEVYKTTSKEDSEKLRQAQEKIKVFAEEYNKLETKNPTDLKEKIKNLLEIDLVTDKVTEKEEQIVEKVQKTKEDEIRDRLRSFTRTIPMFVMANSSKQEITIDNFDKEIDDKDFVDLTNITKEEFHKLRDGFDYNENDERKRFEGVFNKYRFNASIAEFQAKKENLSNYFTSDEDIFELIPNQKNNQIFTPRHVVQMMVNKLEERDPSLFTRTDSTFIDLYMKSGMYVTELVKKLIAGTRDSYNSDNECLKHILENQVYGLAPTQILHDITQSYIFGFDVDKNILRDNFAQHDITPEVREGIGQEKLLELFNLNKDMKFDAVVGNPPYQESTDGYNRQEPIYQYFYDSAEVIGKKYCLISPARFLFNAGLTKKSWNLKMLSNNNLSVQYYNPNSEQIFPNTSIKGGVAVVYYDIDMDFGGIKRFIPEENLRKIVNRIDSKSETDLPSIMFGGRSDLKFNNKFIHAFPNSIKDRLSRIQIKHPEVTELGANEEYELKSSTFDTLLDVFEDKEPKNTTEYYRILGLAKKKREWKWIKKEYMDTRYPKRNNIDKWKIFIPESNGSGAFGETLSSPVIGKPSDSATPTFISIGSFDTKIQANNVLKYIKTKFLRCLLGVLKITQHNPQSNWSCIPLQDFGNESDIDWSKSISEIDQQLYVKYNLSKEEITFIEEKVQVMN